MRTLVTGDAGYIGSHTCVELLNLGHEIMVVDNLCNSSGESLNRVGKITEKRPVFYRVDLLDREGLGVVFAKETVDAMIHFTGLKATDGSVVKPLEYYHNNTTGVLILCDVMRNHGAKRIIFSSSATVYGNPAFVPITEDCPKGKITNPYDQTKGVLEQILTSLHTANPEWSVTLLRYFNPVDAHKSGLVGEDPAEIPNNLMPYVIQVAVGELKEMGVFGDDYDTSDGTGVRDYIHVVDLVIGYVKALDKLVEDNAVRIYSLGTSHGYSVLDMIKTFSKTYGKEIPYVIEPRRPGNIATCYADPALAKEELSWKAERRLEKMYEDDWRWQSNNPNGYQQ